MNRIKKNWGIKEIKSYIAVRPGKIFGASSTGIFISLFFSVITLSNVSIDFRVKFYCLLNFVGINSYSFADVIE